MRRNLTEGEYQAVLHRHGTAVPCTPKHAAPRGKQYRSGLEADYAQQLELEKLTHFIRGWSYEPVNFRLPGHKNFYKIDFVAWGDLRVDDIGCSVTFYEIKGHNRSDDRSLVKMKTAAGLTPWARFVLVKRVHGEWIEKEIQ